MCLKNRFSSKYFKPQRGCWQGDTISPYLNLLCAEIFEIVIRNNKDTVYYRNNNRWRKI